MIRMRIEHKKKLIEERKAKLLKMKEKKKEVEKVFKSDRTEFMSENIQVANAFRKRYYEDDQQQVMLKDNVEKLALVYRQRLGRVLQDFFQTFFIPELS